MLAYARLAGWLYLFIIKGVNAERWSAAVQLAAVPS
jgi:hypothetical protein